MIFISLEIVSSSNRCELSDDFFQLSYLLTQSSLHRYFRMQLGDLVPRVSQTFPMTSRTRLDRTVGFAREK